jgi:uncharacterized protein (TIGR00297 family)
VMTHPAIHPTQLVVGGVLSLLIAVLAYRLHALSVSGAVAAVVEGTLIFGLGGWSWGLLLIAFFVSSSALSRVKGRRKAGLAEKFAKTGRRDAAQALANGGLGASLAVLSVFVLDARPLFVAFVGAMAAVNADPWATELGVLSPRPPRLITTGRQAAVGTSGAVSAWGLAAASAGALFIGICAAIFVAFAGDEQNLAYIPLPQLMWIALLAGLAGALFDSLLGATVQGIYWCERDQKETEKRIHTCGDTTRLLRGWRWIDNEWVNFLCSCAGAAAAWLLFML